MVWQSRPFQSAEGLHRVDADDVETLAGEVVDRLHVVLRGQRLVVDRRHHDVVLGVGFDAVDREGQLGQVELGHDAPEDGGRPAGYLDAAGANGFKAVGQGEQLARRMQFDLVFGLGRIELVDELLLDRVGDRVADRPRHCHAQHLGIARGSRGRLGRSPCRCGGGGFFVTAGGYEAHQRCEKHYQQLEWIATFSSLSQLPPLLMTQWSELPRILAAQPPLLTRFCMYLTASYPLPVTGCTEG